MTNETNITEMEIEWLKSQIIPQLIKENKILDDIDVKERKNVQIKDITADLISPQEAFMSNKCYRSRLTFECNNVTKEMHLFVKKTPHPTDENSDDLKLDMFRSEIVTYEKIMPTLESFGKFKINIPKYFFGELKPNAASIIIENFRSQSWTMTKDRYNLSLEHAIVACKTLAQFHAVGFALRAKERKLFDELTRYLLQPPYTINMENMYSQWQLEYTSATKRALKAAREYGTNISKEFLEKYEAALRIPHIYCKGLLQPTEPFVTVCHGDFLRNNIAYKYEKSGDNSVPIDLLMFDLQAVTVSTPMLDLVTFMALSTCGEMRAKHFQEIFQTYCKQIKESYTQFAHEALPEYLSQPLLLKEYIRILPFGLFVSSFFLHELVQPGDLSPEDFLSKEFSDEDFIARVLNNGGTIVDRELADQMKELYELATQYNVNVF